MSIPLIVILVIVVVLVVAIIGLYNNLVKLRNMVDNAWAQIDVQLQRRLDLIPNLVETVKGYASHERGTLEEVTQARTAVKSPLKSNVRCSTACSDPSVSACAVMSTFVMS